MMNLNNCHALVTGGAGFIGSHLANRLLVEGAHVRIIDNLSTGRIENIPAAAEYVEGDIRNQTLVEKVMKGIDIVFHEAAQINPAKAVEDPLFDFENNAKGTLITLLAAKNAGVKKFIMASTNLYGNAGIRSLPESFSTLSEKNSLLSPYAAAKASAEAYLKVANDKLGIATVRLRYFNVYGPRQLTKSESGVVALMVTNAMAGKPLIIFGSGLQTRDFVFIDDAIEANILAARLEQANGEAFNVGTGHETAIRSLAKMISDLTGTRAPIEHQAERAAEFYQSRADLSKAHTMLGFKPKTNLPDGLRQYIHWYRTYTESYVPR